MLIGSTAIGKGLSIADFIHPNPNVGICFTSEFTEEQLNLLIADAAFNLPTKQTEKVRTTFKNTDPAFRLEMANCVALGDYSDELLTLEKANMPIAVVYGAEEKLAITNTLDKIKFQKWKNKTILIPDSGHCCQLDQPVKLAELIKEFASDCFR